MTPGRLRQIVDSRRGQYAGADFSAIVVPTTAGPRMTRAIIRFAFPDTPHSDETVDYGDLRLVRKRVSVEQALTLVEGCLAGVDNLQGFDFGVEPFGPMFLAPRVTGHLPAPVGERLTGQWPSLEVWLRPNQQLPYREPPGPLIRRGLPILANPHEYATDWLGVDRPRQGHEPNLVVIYSPDHRLRLGPVTFGVEDVGVAVSFGPGARTSVLFKVAWLTTQPIKENWVDPRVEADGLRFSYPAEWSTLQVYALDETTGELLDWVEVHRAYGYLANDVVVVQSSEKQFAELLEEWETQTVEFKSSVNPNNAHDFVQTVVAFANTDGGVIFVGIEDNGNVVGVRNPETVEQIVTNVIEEFCEPALIPSFEVIVYATLRVLAVTVAAGKDRPYVHRPTGAIYVRRGSHDRPGRRAEILELAKR